MINILDLIYPPVCGMCGNINKENLCPKCSVKIKKYEINYKKTFKNKNIYFDELYCVLKYEDLVRNNIIKYKFQNKSYMYKTFAKIILKNKKICGFFKKYDIIIPVPIHNKRKRTRGYNQTELVAKEIAQNIDGLKLEKNILIKQKNTKAQSELTKKERNKNVLGAFKINNIKIIENKNILLFDDIYTTGSTVNECSKILKQAGARKVGVLTIAKD